MLCNFRIYWSALLLDWLLYRCILLLSSEQLENNCFSMLCRTCKCWQYFIVKYFKIVFMTITTHLLREVFSCWEGSSSWWWIQVFQKFWFSFECSNCTISYKCCQHFSWCDRLTSFIFDKPFAKYSNVNKHSFGNEKWLSFHEKQTAYSACISNGSPAPSPWGNHSTLAHPPTLRYLLYHHTGH